MIARCSLISSLRFTSISMPSRNNNRKIQLQVCLSISLLITTHVKSDLHPFIFVMFTDPKYVANEAMRSPCSDPHLKSMDCIVFFCNSRLNVINSIPWVNESTLFQASTIWGHNFATQVTFILLLLYPYCILGCWGNIAKLTSLIYKLLLFPIVGNLLEERLQRLIHLLSNKSSLHSASWCYILLSGPPPLQHIGRER